MITSRLAPTPSGHLHLGNALAFGAAWLSARNVGGRVLLRVEDLDRGRARDEIAQGQWEDLQWLGLDWDAETPAQSTRKYSTEGVPTYRCICNRRTRLAGACACRDAGYTTGTVRFRCPPGEVCFGDRARGPQVLAPGDDPVLVSADGEPAYSLAVVLDDARDGVTEVVRGADLLDATPAQIRLHEALSLPVPTYLHVPLLLGPDRTKLSKSHGSTELRALRAAGWSPDDVWTTLWPLLGLPPGPLRCARLEPSRVPRGPFVLDATAAVLP